MLRATRRDPGVAQGFLPELNAVLADPDLGLARAFAGGEVSRLEAGTRFADGEKLTALLDANVSMQSSLAAMNEDKLPELIELITSLQERLTPLVEGLNNTVTNLIAVARNL